MEVATGVHRATLGVVNWYIVEAGQKLTLVDAGTPKDWALLEQTVRELGRELADVDAVLLTHAHGDHVGFAEQARTAADARVHVHTADAPVAKGDKPGKNDGSMLPYLWRAEGYRTLFSLVRRGGTRIIPVAEVSTFADGDVIDVPGQPRVIHAPGHTPGCSALWFADRSVLCTGDSLVTRNPLTGRTGPQVMPSGFNQDTAAALRSIDNLSGLDATTLLPGHGEPWREGADEAVRHARAAGRS